MVVTLRKRVLFNLVTKALPDSARPRALPKYMEEWSGRVPGSLNYFLMKRAEEYDRVGQRVFVTRSLTNAVGHSTGSRALPTYTLS